jgi:hypothetical protein
MQEVHGASGLLTDKSIQKKIFALLSEDLCRSEESRQRAVQVSVKPFY